MADMLKTPDISEASKKNNNDTDLGEVWEILDPAEELRLVRKIDFRQKARILPLMLVAYMLQFLDKQTLSSSTIMGIITDLKLHGFQYSWASSCFYFGYLFATYPVSLILIKFPLGKSLSIMFLIWAIILACHAATKNFATLMVARFFLGIAEASISPGFSLITSLWYRTSEQPWRHGLWFCGNSVSSVFSGLIGYGIYHIHDSLASWKWLFIIFGILTFVWGLVLLWRLPDSPQNAKFISGKEKKIAIHRLKANQAGFKSNKLELSQIKETLLDYKTWLVAVYSLTTNIPNGGSLAFSSLILEGFGFSVLNTFLMGIPIGIVIFVFVLSSTYLSSKLPNARCLIIAAVNIISITGAVIIYTCDTIGAKYAGLCLMQVFSSGMPLSMALVSSNIGGFTKRATVITVLFTCYCAGNIIGPQLFFAREAPRYKSGFLAIIICFAISTVTILVLRYLLIFENNKRDRTSVPVEQREELRLADLTDIENKNFRYAY
ncbi:hypothetical protein N7462_010967 [Penicillium macrosclerotiorum]|uniref:uncharacterized protein n=1 Tax=Penicillium macrosclerotiorum TaxID=303699 RepID=UPI002546DA23|nr:uncharacterized protein N7462_010967 [Penicillium macrosclerotiorum]KAJ5666558.1 hypothetical protein N7462_010967 [Penicillium macrosclerotiorum]